MNLEKTCRNQLHVPVSILARTCPFRKPGLPRDARAPQVSRDGQQRASGCWSRPVILRAVFGCATASRAPMRRRQPLRINGVRTDCGTHRDTGTACALVTPEQTGMLEPNRNTQSFLSGEL